MAGRNKQEALYKPGQNCCRLEKADKASLLIDCANYYKALYEAICKARHSIFILGWDIDGRIELLRGKEAENARYPVRFADLIIAKAEENPDLQIYLNKWDASIFLMQEREPFSGLKWHFQAPENVKFVADKSAPLLGCQHQKLVTVDDRIAFCGGMDIALYRWDDREHCVERKERFDPGGYFFPWQNKYFSPYHDIQSVMSGQVVTGFAEIVRERWENAGGETPVPLRIYTEKEGEAEGNALWPSSVTPHFENHEIAISRTLPAGPGQSEVKEILKSYLDEITQARNFIYIENQYLSCPDIARALNKQLKKEPELRVLVVSCEEPRGLFEKRILWYGRTAFAKIVTEGIDPARFAITYPHSRHDGGEESTHIHSKLMIVDDRILHLGSANLNTRSMGYDSECDFSLVAEKPKDRDQIKHLLYDLIREHTGREIKDITALVENGGALKELIAYQEHSIQHLHEVDDTAYENDRLGKWLTPICDPPHAPSFLGYFKYIKPAFLLGLLALGQYLVAQNYETDFFEKDNLIAFIQSTKTSVWSPLIFSLLYIVAGVVFFPVTVLNLCVLIVYGPLYGITYATLGSLVSAAFGYGVGRFFGTKFIHDDNALRHKIRHYLNRGELIGMTMIRFIPLAPFIVMNVAFGLLKIRFLTYMLATLLGLAPGIIAKAIFGDAIGKIWDHPDPVSISYLIAAVVSWILIIWGTHKLVSHFQQTTGKTHAA